MIEADHALPLQKVVNFRDVGTAINEFSHQELMKTGLLYRSGIPDDATPLDRLKLSTQFAIKTIVDLRTDTEHAEQARKNEKKIPTPAVADSANAADPNAALRIPGVEYRCINFNGRAFSSALIRQLSYWNTAKLFALYFLGYRTEAIAVLGENVMAQRGLVGLAEDSLTHCGQEIKEVFDVLARKESYPLLVHCTQGKDRTGLTVLLVLLLLGAPLDAIDHDYMASDSELLRGRDERVQQITSVGLPEEFAGCVPGWVEKVSAWIEETHGGIEAYLQDCGVGLQQQEQDSTFSTARTAIPTLEVLEHAP